MVCNCVRVGFWLVSHGSYARADTEILVMWLCLTPHRTLRHRRRRTVRHDCAEWTVHSCSRVYMLCACAHCDLLSNHLKHTVTFEHVCAVRTPDLWLRIDCIAHTLISRRHHRPITNFVVFTIGPQHTNNIDPLGWIAFIITDKVQVPPKMIDYFGRYIHIHKFVWSYTYYVGLRVVTFSQNYYNQIVLQFDDQKMS